MNCRRLSLLGLGLVLLLGSACNEKKESSSELPTYSDLDESSSPRPIDIVVERHDDLKSTEFAPGLEAPLGPIGPIAPVAPIISAPIGPVLPPPPIGFIVEDECRVEFCGDGIEQDNEDCDDGNNNNGDECDNFCREPECGNSIVEGEEECDAPNNINCTQTCTLPLCGNGVVDLASETCDPPNDTTCNATCLLSVCGNSIVELGEECDDGTNGDDTDGCSDECTLVPATPPLSISKR